MTGALDSRIVDALKRKGWLELTKPQEAAIPEILAGRNVLLIAPTGIGKTEAAVIPIFHRLLEGEHPGIAVLYITPLRALNRDMLRRMEYFAGELGLDIAVRHGDTSQRERQRQSRSPPQMLITTPETLQIMFAGKRLREHLRNVRYVVIDELHELVGEERGAQLSVALERLVELSGREFQRVGLSATVGDPDPASRFLVGVGRDVEVVQVEHERGMRIVVESPEPMRGDELERLTRSEPKDAAALRRAREIVEAHTSTLFFVNTRDSAEILATKFRMWDEDVPIGIHHGSLSKGVRVQMEDDFKSGRLRSLICTSSLELGIDVGTADHTIQYNSPRQVARLVQRVGRAGHAIHKTPEGTVIALDADDVAEAAVTARRALSGELEGGRVRESPMTVLANQLMAWASADYHLDLRGAYEVVRRAYPFRSLGWEEFSGVAEQLRGLGLLWLEDGGASRRRGALEYFYSNLSMIPDERTYAIRDVTSRQVIGTLDESYVAISARPQTVFIIKGRPWMIVEVLEEEVLVEPVKDLGDVPNWVGEDIPVSFEVAQEVARLRASLDWEGYPVTPEARGVLERLVEEQRRKGHPVPSDRLITIEVGERLVIINACLGSRGNETVGRLLSALLMARMGESVGMRSDPYRIILDPPRSIGGESVRQLLLGIDPDGLDELLGVIMRRSTHLRWQFFHVARKFGVIKRDADYRSVNIERLMEAYRDSVIYQETVDKVLWEKMDLSVAKSALRAMQSGEVELRVTGLSPIGMAGYEARWDYMVPQRPDHSILMALKRRIMEERVVLLCTSCGWTSNRQVGSVGGRVACGRCSSVLVAALSPHDMDKARLVKKRRRDEGEERELRRLVKNANLVMAGGQRAVIALRGRGVGPDAAARILSNLHREEDDFYRDILEAEIRYARTKRFWK